MTRVATRRLLLSLLVAAAAWAVSSLALAQPEDGGDKSAATKSATGTKAKSPEDSSAADSGKADDGKNSDNRPDAHDGDQTDASDQEAAEKKATPTSNRRQGLMAGLTIFVLAVFVGFEVITKVPPTLHTPLMSGSNAISGITLVGAVVVAGVGLYSAFDHVTASLGMLAVALATVNVVGGFLVTHRMLAMFKKKK